MENAMVLREKMARSTVQFLFLCLYKLRAGGSSYAKGLGVLMRKWAINAAASAAWSMG
jgi:hypothetical protein